MKVDELTSPEVLKIKEELERSLADDFGLFIGHKIESIINEGANRVRGAFNRGYAEGRKYCEQHEGQEAYNKGMLKAWEIARRLIELGIDGLDDLFDAESAHDVIAGWTPQVVEEQLESARPTKKKNDEVVEGDEVYCTKETYRKFVVISVAGGKYTGIAKDGDVIVNANPEFWKKTGKHFDKLFLNNSSKENGCVRYETDQLPF